MPVSPQTLNKMVLLLVSGLPEDAVIAACIDNLGMAQEEARDAYAEARRRVVLAAEYHPDEELGRAITRLNDLYSRSLKIQDNKTALAVQREVNRILLDRSPAAGPGTPDAGEDEDAAAARNHLEALAYAPPGTPLAELARLAVQRIVGLESLEKSK